MCRRLPTSGNVGRQQLNYHVTKHVYWVEKNQSTMFGLFKLIFIYFETNEWRYFDLRQRKIAVLLTYPYIYEYLACLCYENHIY